MSYLNFYFLFLLTFPEFKTLAKASECNKERLPGPMPKQAFQFF